LAAAPAGAVPDRRSVAAPATTAAPLPAPKAWAAVDADTGNVIDAGNDRTPLPPASLTKILTALAVVNSLPPDATVPVSARAAGQPAHKISMQQGQVWTLKDSLYALLLSSANDAAVALAERAGGTVEGFQRMFMTTADEMGLSDHPVLQDPAGLDGTSGVDGGNLVSARDLAIAARDLLANPTLAPIVADPVYHFVGPDGVHHRLLNHNWHFLQTYPGAIGMKTGFTDRAGPSLITAARRNGRTMLAVVLNAPNEYAFSVGLLDKGFATPVGAEQSTDQLPAVWTGQAQPAAAAAATGVGGDAAPAPGDMHAAPRLSPSSSRDLLSAVTRVGGGWPFWLAVILVATVGLLRLRVVLRTNGRHRRRGYRPAGQNLERG
jgi:D-alanyl-D-alanine carboxypeptidase